MNTPTAYLRELKMVSQSEMIRRLNCPESRFLKLVAAGLIQPDSVISDGRMRLYDLARLQEIQKLLQTPEVLA